jgi:peptidoglycan LD-endopeptidase LytH
MWRLSGDMHKNISYKLFLVLVLPLFMSMTLSTEVRAESSNTRLLDLCKDFNALNAKVRDNNIKKTEAKSQFKNLIEAIGKEYYASGGKDYSDSNWVFPLKGYGYKAIGGVNGNGYQKGGYDYFDGNKHTGHPSLDIFIRDKKQIGIDDVTKKPVSVLSVSGGVVVAVEKDWDSSSHLRGGKYIWIYDPTSNALIYYAHNSRVQVEAGDIVKPGDIVAEVGRTGLNAHKKRSPSHLHLTCLSIVNGLPVARNIYKELLSSKLM